MPRRPAPNLESDFDTGPADAVSVATPPAPPSRRDDGDGDGDETTPHADSVATPPAPAPAPAASDAPAPDRAGIFALADGVRNRLQEFFWRGAKPGNPHCEPAPEPAPRCPIMRRVISAPDVRAALATARAALAKLESTRAEVRHLLDPESYRNGLVARMGEANDPAEIERLRGELAGFAPDAMRASRISGQRIIARVFADEVEPALRHLLQCADAAAEIVAEEIAGEEAKLFARYDTPRTATAITAKARAIRERIKNAGAILDQQPPASSPVPYGLENIVAVFG